MTDSVLCFSITLRLLSIMRAVVYDKPFSVIQMILPNSLSKPLNSVYNSHNDMHLRQRPSHVRRSHGSRTWYRFWS
ncbi:hypothetical protein BV22DRAFT_623959 [Leucogyrophana mollusca]|uniref:Uncharacterized protein n=1 Tax=Leucogyrophana mollusca TaxID=85980 RepID=A0ACB8BBR0_9AGAM|nr:hypothetical protein BV22DRAFT_623959 [Leucogyrophana mollusca]